MYERFQVICTSRQVHGVVEEVHVTAVTLHFGFVFLL